MSSLQKFHRRTQVTAIAPVLGTGSDTIGYYLGKAGDNTSYMYVAPSSTQSSELWGSYGITRSTLSTTNGLGNTNTLVSFGTAAHPAAGYCKYLTTGGYNTWYLPARDELITLYTNKAATPFATTNGFSGSYHWSSTEASAGNAANKAFSMNMSTGTTTNRFKSTTSWVRAVRRS